MSRKLRTGRVGHLPTASRHEARYRSRSETTQPGRSWSDDTRFRIGPRFIETACRWTKRIEAAHDIAGLVESRRPREPAD